MLDYKNFDEKEILSENFAVKIINLERYLREMKKELIISHQIFRSGTSIGAHISEAKFAESRSDFKHKLAGAQKEGNETLYWLRLLYRTKFIDDKIFNSLYQECLVIMKILSNIIKKLKNDK